MGVEVTVEDAEGTVEGTKIIAENAAVVVEGARHIGVEREAAATRLSTLRRR